MHQVDFIKKWKNRLYDGEIDQFTADLDSLLSSPAAGLPTLPTDEEVKKWFDENVPPSDASVSSTIFKFRLWLRSRLKEGGGEK